MTVHEGFTMLARMKRYVPDRVKERIKSVTRGLVGEPSSKQGTEISDRPCASRWSEEVCECDMQLGAFKAERIRNTLTRILEGEGIEFVAVGDANSHVAVAAAAMEALKTALDANGVQYQSKTKRTSINVYDFPVAKAGFSYADLVPLEYEELTIVPTYFCKSRKPDAAAFGAKVTTYTDTHEARLFHSNLVPVRTKALATRDLPTESVWPIMQPAPIDVVITTVDGSDPVWQQKFNRRLVEREGDSVLAKTTNPGRYSSHDELRFLLRSLYYYAPYVRTIHIVTDEQCPEWLDTDHPRIKLIDHKDIIDPIHLPTFNSDAIESCLWKIPGLAEHFLYFNDDLLLMSLTSEATFFTPSGLPRFDVSPRHLPDIPPEWAGVYTMHAHLQTADAIAKRGYPRPTRKFKHIPFPVRKSIFMEIEEEFADELEETRNSPFRSEASYATISFMYPHFALATGRAMYSSIGYRYIDIAEEGWRSSLIEACGRTDVTVACINEAHDAHEDPSLDDDIRRILTARFPAVPPWEQCGVPAPGDRLP